MIARCNRCGGSLGYHQKDEVQGGDKCIACKTHERVEMIVNVLPSEGDTRWQQMPESRRKFLTSVRRQLQAKRILSESQYDVLEQIWIQEN